MAIDIANVLWEQGRGTRADFYHVMHMLVDRTIMCVPKEQAEALFRKTYARYQETGEKGDFICWINTVESILRQEYLERRTMLYMVSEIMRKCGYSESERQKERDRWLDIIRKYHGRDHL